MGRPDKLLSRIGRLHDVSREHEDGLGHVLTFEHMPDYHNPSVTRKEATLAATAGGEGEYPSKGPVSYCEIGASSGTLRWEELAYGEGCVDKTYRLSRSRRHSHLRPGRRPNDGPSSAQSPSLSSRTKCPGPCFRLPPRTRTKYPVSILSAYSLPSSASIGHALLDL